MLEEYQNKLLPMNEIRCARTANVRERNLNNLYLSLLILIIFLLGFIIFDNFSESTAQAFIKATYLLVLIRFVFRAFEICYAFYLDIKPTVILKKTNLLGTH